MRWAGLNISLPKAPHRPATAEEATSEVTGRFGRLPSGVHASSTSCLSERDGRNMMDHAAQQIVMHRFRRDFELFGYTPLRPQNESFVVGL